MRSSALCRRGRAVKTISLTTAIGKVTAALAISLTAALGRDTAGLTISLTAAIGRGYSSTGN